MTYLSIDLDYWFYHDREEFASLFSLLENLSSIKDRTIVQEHQELLPHINKVKPDHILHVDYHQDICYPTSPNEKIPIACGSFFYHVQERKNKTFKWFYPNYYSCIKQEVGVSGILVHKSNLKCGPVVSA